VNNLDLITDALRELGVLDRYRSPVPEDASLALRKLNALMSNMEGDGIDLGYFPQTDVNDELPLDDDAAAAVLPIFAIALKINFPSAQIPPELSAWAGSNMQRLLRNAVLLNAQEASMSNLPRGEGQGWRGNILTGE